MRLHELSITAFGPFAGTVHVDFDELAAGGLFLLTGDTGSGKTSVLDAVCFALYGEVPGDRHAARHLRCDQAEPDVAPEVTLHLSIGARTFRFARSPAWERPKRRGSGTTRVQAHVVVEEERDGQWHALTNRLDEAGHLVTALLGMTCAQFTQVAMLPQGRFQAFLRATSAERQAVLQRLFRTRRFEDVERWLVERRLTLHRASDAHHQRAGRVVSRLLEAAGAELPEGWGDTGLDGLDARVADGSLDSWVTGLCDDAGAGRERAAEVLSAAETDTTARRDEVQHARATAAARARGRSALLALEDLAATADEEAALRDSLEQHQRAAPVLPLATAAEEAAAAARAVRNRASGPVAEAALLLRTFPETLEASALEVATRAVRAERTVAETWLPGEQELASLRDRQRAAADDAERLAARSAELARQESALATRAAGVREALQGARAVAARATDDTTARQRALAGHAAALEVQDVTARLADTEQVLRESTEEAQDLREAYQDLREQRISGMAAELAVGLAAGCSCPVCGSHDHPSPASAHVRVGKDDEDAARDAWETAAFAQQTAQDAVSGLRARLDAVLPKAEGRTVGEWDAEVRETEAALAESTAAVAEAEEHAATLAALEADRAASATESTTTAVMLRERQRQHDELTRRVDRLAAELRTLLSGHPGVSGVADLLAELDRVLRVLDDARSALTRRDRADDEAARAARAAASAAVGAGFGSLAEAVAAALDEGEAGSRTCRLRERDDARAAAEAVLAEAEVHDALAAEPVDVAPLESALREAELARDAAHAAQQHAVLRATRLHALADELAGVLREWEPVREQHAVTAGLAALVEGKSADNRWRMRLSAYVLSERLRQVVAAANERLGAMTDERYTLAQVDEKGAGEQRGGLSLRVRDEWSGKERDPATLSGGETFLVSLALALGLADTVSHEAGGTQLDTLFVDEGFGALDATTLDGVMDVLDGLRDGGRVVGLVSHVPELRDRVTTRLEVRKARRGSTLTPVLVGD